MADRSTCRSCGAPIVWARTPAGKLMPLDVTPTTAGNVILHMGPERGQATAHVETAAESATRRAHPIPAAQLAYVPHFATCPNAKVHRGGGRKR